MANFLESKRIAIGDLYKRQFFSSNKLIIFYWEGFKTAYETEANNNVVIRRLDSDHLEIGYLLGEGDDEQKIIYQIRLVRASNCFTGFRYYFICPLKVKGVPCRRRVSVLYRPDEEMYFACRHCHEIKYSTQMISPQSSAYLDVKRGLIEKKIEELEEGVFRETYRGKKTRKQLRLEQLRKEARRYPSMFYTSHP